jgi:hypothetical protein
MAEFGLGRIAAPDPRDHNFLMKSTLRRAGVEVVRRTRHYPLFHPALDQGDTSSCVGHAWKGWLLAGPVISGKPASEPTAFTLYRECLPLDPWPQNDGDGETMQFGTSTRAGAQALQRRRHIGTFVNAFDADTVIDWLCAVGPVVVGTDWHTQMFFPNSEGVIKPEGAIEGGHAYLLVGVDMKRGRVRVHNSWGTKWGQRGRAWLGFDDLAKLLEAGGEAITAAEEVVKR